MIVESVKGLGENRSLATIIIFRVTPMVALALLIISYLTVDATEQAVERQLRDHLRRENDHALSVIDGRLDSIHAVGRAFARNELVVNALFDPENRDNYLPALFRNPSLPGSAKARVTLVDYRGRPIISGYSGTPFEAGSVYWSEALSRGEEDFHVDGGGVAIGIPVLYAGFPEGGVILQYPQDQVGAIFDPEGVFLSEAILGPNDQVLYSSDSGFLEQGGINRAHGKPGWITLERALPDYPQITLVTAEREDSAYAPVKRLTNLLGVAFFAVLVALIWGIWRAADLARGQVRDFIAIIGGIGRAEDLGRRLKHKGAVEFRELTAAFNNMLENLERTTISRNRVDRILNSMNEMLIVTSTAGEVQTLNPAAEAFFRDSLDKTVSIGTPIGGLLRSNDQKENAELAEFLKSTGLKHQFDATYETASNERETVRWSKSVLVDPEFGPVGVIVIGQDITDQVEAARLKDEFISTVSHELRTPLTAINGTLGLLRGGVMGDLGGEIQQLLAIGQDNADRLLRLINDLLDLQKLEADGMVFRMETLRLHDLLANAVEVNRSYADQYHVNLIFARADDDLENVMVRVDRIRFLQVMTNLLSNACKFSPKGADVVLRLGRSHAGMVVSVVDRGPGVPDDFKDRIFTRFAQADGSDTREKGGTGLGLYLVKVMTERMGGTVWFEGNDHGGTTFFISLPEDGNAGGASPRAVGHGDPADKKATANRRPFFPSPPSD